jgi:hypothetical protein
MPSILTETARGHSGGEGSICTPQNINGESPEILGEDTDEIPPHHYSQESGAPFDKELEL